ncbi:MAG: ABC transporter ATP-binding protein [Leptolyngbyaceae cyanobacterium MO_188.B28]|nr:ABC transporter ATP-binding protein [Leptolyngbyaceae cyanobacterium MO_188.B28]
MPLEAQNLSGGYGDTRIVEAVNLTLNQGEWLSLVGANGSGKSTLLKLLSRILKPQTGVVLLDAKAIHSQPTQAVARKLAILPQQPPIPPGLTVRQLVSLGRTPHQPWWRFELDGESQRYIQYVLALTEMEAFSDRPVAELSGGERQRAFLSLALAQNPQVLLLDEPTTFLDIRYQLQLLELLKRLNRDQKLAIITVLHDINLAVRYSDRLALMRQGQLWAVGEPAEALTPANLQQVFDVDAVLIDTPVGLQICPLAPAQSTADLPISVP